ncbi:hypothetical protein [Sulfuritalea sp.]|uniref:hypothetical protein n=1 Tax=Sulfuritalea sp. TaxID=2480090 RepID=UPI00286DE849|nr:hypothetical protein [Sulfuritalea sp.]
MSSLQEELTELSTLATANCDSRGVAIVAAGEDACKQLLLWLQYLRTSQTTGTADCLLDATISAAQEGIACVALGLVRPALNSLRLQIDLSLAWLYFKDHPIEWRRVQDTGEGFKLKTELLKYIGEMIIRYPARFGLLRTIKTRSQEDPYRLLSAHIHGQSESALPQVQKPKDIVATPKVQDEAIALQRECSEYINDIFWSVFTDRWASVPMELRTTLENRFKTPDQRVCFFE